MFSCSLELMEFQKNSSFAIRKISHYGCKDGIKVCNINNHWRVKMEGHISIYSQPSRDVCVETLSPWKCAVEGHVGKRKIYSIGTANESKNGGKGGIILR